VMKRVAELAKLSAADQFVYSGRAKRVYAIEQAGAGRVTMRFKPGVDQDTGALLGVPSPRAATALSTRGPVQRIPLVVAEPNGVERSNWPVTQGLPFARGQVATADEIRILDPQDKEVPAQVRAASLWEDDSV